MKKKPIKDTLTVQKERRLKDGSSVIDMKFTGRARKLLLQSAMLREDTTAKDLFYQYKGVKKDSKDTLIDCLIGHEVLMLLKEYLDRYLDRGDFDVRN